MEGRGGVKGPLRRASPRKRRAPLTPPPRPSNKFY